MIPLSQSGGPPRSNFFADTRARRAWRDWSNRWAVSAIHVRARESLPDFRLRIQFGLRLPVQEYNSGRFSKRDEKIPARLWYFPSLCRPRLASPTIAHSPVQLSRRGELTPALRRIVDFVMPRRLQGTVLPASGRIFLEYKI